VVNQVFSENKAQYISYLEAASGLGMIVGPPLGSLIYGFSGYQWSFYAFSILILSNFAQCVFLIPNKINKAATITTEFQSAVKIGHFSALSGQAAYNNEAIMRLEKRREIERKKKAADREALLSKHTNESANFKIRRGGRQRRNSQQEREQ